MKEPVKVVQVGLGPIGQKVVQYALEREGIELVGAVDPAPDKCGSNVADLCSLETDPGVVVAADLEQALAGAEAGVAFLTTFSDLERVVPQVEELAECGLDVVSTCEELSYPWNTQPELSKRLDAVAKENEVSVLGTGVNPGFLMDSLPAVASGVCQLVERVQVWRVQDASPRRIPFQKKIGAGLDLDAFEEKKSAGTLRHVGLTESMHMIAAAFGWELDGTEDILSPVIAEEKITTGYKPIQEGQAAGVEQIGRGYVDGEELVTLTFRAAVGEKDPADSVQLSGTPELFSTIPGGVNGDIATCAITVNAVSSVLRSGAGLKTMLDVPPVSYSKTPRSEV